MAMSSSACAVTACGSRSEILGRLLEELEALPAEEVMRVRLFAGLRRIVSDRRRAAAAAADGSGSGSSSSFFLELFGGAETGMQSYAVSLLAARDLVALEATHRQWRELPQRQEHWYSLGVQTFAGQRRLVPPGRFERFDESMLTAETNWPRRYGNFVQAARCSIESLRQAAIRIVQSIDLETCDIAEVRQRLCVELQVGHGFLSIECVEQLLEDATSLRSAGGLPLGASLLGDDDDRGGPLMTSSANGRSSSA